MIIMLEKLLKFESWGSKEQIMSIISHLREEEINKKTLKELQSYENYRYLINFDTQVRILLWLDLISEVDNVLKLKYSKPINSIVFIEIFFNKIISEISLYEIFNSKTIYSNDNQVIFKNRYLKIKYSPLRNFLISFGFFEKDKDIPNTYFINSDYIGYFNQNLTKNISLSSKRKITLKEFKEINKLKEIQGALAEEYVVHFERKLRENHSNFAFIKRISEEDVAAGYDIQSYMSDESIILDKFIEVKSFSNHQSFYWTKNEFETAKKLGKNYFLYIIDMNNYQKNGYSPLIIQDPSNEIDLDAECMKTCQSWKISLLKN